MFLRCCTGNCTFVAGGVECRASTGPCDVADVCTGVSGGCPVDVRVAAGTVCTPSDEEAEDGAVYTRSDASTCDLDCSGYADCDECAAAPGCGWCDGNEACVVVGADGSGEGACEDGDAAATECGAKVIGLSAAAGGAVLGVASIVTVGAAGGAVFFCWRICCINKRKAVEVIYSVATVDSLWLRSRACRVLMRHTMAKNDFMFVCVLFIYFVWFLNPSTIRRIHYAEGDEMDEDELNGMSGLRHGQPAHVLPRCPVVLVCLLPWCARGEKRGRHRSIIARTRVTMLFCVFV